uniref:Uncharacterized protein n=1 Tax=Populus alba TaxID=43335 RepID=A0A4V6A2H9_POPAL|nr:hypothetical protein D5086_0000275850 [Populus alba]
MQTDEVHIADAINIATEEISGSECPVHGSLTTSSGIRPEESIILNILHASVDFTTFESIKVSRQVDKTGQWTIAVVTKAHKAPEGLLEKVTPDDVSIGLGYVCVRNRIGDESCEDDADGRRKNVCNSSTSFHERQVHCWMSKAMTSITESVTAFMEVMDQRVAEENPVDR